MAQFSNEQLYAVYRKTNGYCRHCGKNWRFAITATTVAYGVLGRLIMARLQAEGAPSALATGTRRVSLATETKVT